MSHDKTLYKSTDTYYTSPPFWILSKFFQIHLEIHPSVRSVSETWNLAGLWVLWSPTPGKISPPADHFGGRCGWTLLYHRFPLCWYRRSPKKYLGNGVPRVPPWLQHW